MGRHPFDLLMELPVHHIRLDCAALHLARDVYAEVDLRRYVQQLDSMAEAVAQKRPGLSAPWRYRALREVLVEQHGFTGTGCDYFDPENGYLNRVLDRRVGLPVTLAAVWIEVARRLKWPVRGVALPGHFLVRCDDPERYLLIDPSADGRTLTVDECREYVTAHLGRTKRFAKRMLKPVGTREVLVHMLRHLRRIYLARCDWDRLATVLRRLIAIEPHRGEHLQDLASVCARRGDMRGAYGCLAAYLRRTPNADDSAIVQWNLERLGAALVAQN